MFKFGLYVFRNQVFHFNCKSRPPERNLFTNPDPKHAQYLTLSSNLVQRNGTEMKKLLLLLLAPLAGLAQQDPQFTINNDYNSFVNPAFMVNDYKLNVTAQHRQQWIGFDGRPITTLANASYFIEKIKSGFGISYMHDQLGAQRSMAGTINYAYDIRIKTEHHLIPSIQFGLLHNSLDGSKLDPIQDGDPNIVTSKTTAYNFDMGLGIAYRFQGITVGFSAMHLTSPTVNLGDGTTNSSYNVARHYYGLASYEAKISRIWRIKPIAFVKSDAASIQFDQFLWVGTRNLNKYFDGVSVGGGYRIDDAAMVGIEFKLKWFTLAYTYDITTSGIRNYSSGSHEAYLRIHLFQVTKSNDQQ